MDMSNVNILAVLVAAASTFVIGGVWYSPILFASAWMKENGFKEEEMKNANMGKIFSLSFILEVVIGFNLAMFLSDSPPDLAWGAIAGFLAAVWVAAAMGITYLFERKSFKLFAINAGYHIVAFVIMGGIIGIWK